VHHAENEWVGLSCTSAVLMQRWDGLNCDGVCVGEWGRGMVAGSAGGGCRVPHHVWIAGWTLVAGLRFRRSAAGTRPPTRLRQRQRRHLARRGQAALLAAAAAARHGGAGVGWVKTGLEVPGYMHPGEVEGVKSVIRTHILYDFFCFCINIFLLACGACIQFFLISSKKNMHMW
jgi:hypothetical protein